MGSGLLRPGRKVVSVILAAGKGTRMRDQSIHKVCLPIEGRPAITRAVEQYSRLGVCSNCIVVGSMADQVIEAAASTSGHSFFCYQREQRGTGSAARAAAEELASVGFDGDVLVVAGDKVLEDSIIYRLIDTFYRSDSDLAFVVGDVADFPTAGRIVRGADGRIIGNVEMFDLARYDLLVSLRRLCSEHPVSASEAEALALSCLGNARKSEKALGKLWGRIRDGVDVTLQSLDLSFRPEDLRLSVCGTEVDRRLMSRAAEANLSVYMFRASALYEAVHALGSDNAQGEEYLTDVIGILSAGGHRVDAVRVERPEEAMAFNTPEELDAIREYHAGKRAAKVTQSPRTLRRASEWIGEFSLPSRAAHSWLASTYGPDYVGADDKRCKLVSALETYIARYGDSDVIITRAPGRLNLMGRHVDHQGGHGNMIAIDCDTYLVIGARTDRLVRLCNLDDAHFPSREFHIDDLMAGYGGDWVGFVNGHAVAARLTAAKGDWSQYVIAPVLRLQARFPRTELRGMSILATGDVPIAAGLSSSSSIVVAVAEGVCHLNDLKPTSSEFVELCGEAEWYVGTRGGAGDHAAMRLASRGWVVQVGFFPFGATATAPFPDGYRFMICNSQIRARKTDGARDVFNHRVACYNIGREIFKRQNPEHAPVIHHLRDIRDENLGVGYPELLTMLEGLPVSLTRSEVISRLGRDLSQRYLASHSDTIDTYPIRSVVMYGLAECERSRRCVGLLESGDVTEFGRWMNVSHDGDRVAYRDSSGNQWPFTVDYSDMALDDLVQGWRMGIAKSRLADQPGAYSCSIPQIDRMVDTALRVQGVLGAQIAGAGLGGCIMVLLRNDACADLMGAMRADYYGPAGLDPSMFACSAVSGSGVVSV